jgi:hypothetical protein
VSERQVFVEMSVFRARSIGDGRKRTSMLARADLISNSKGRLMARFLGKRSSSRVMANGGAWGGVCQRSSKQNKNTKGR